jgi:hypothetical protein
MKRNALNRAVEVFIIKYPEYADRVRMHGEGFSITFVGYLYKETASFRPYTPRDKVSNWLGRCRLTDKKLLDKRDAYEAGQMQDKLL